MRNPRHTIIAAAAGMALVAAAAALAPHAVAGERLTVVSTGGDYEASQLHAYITPYRKITGRAVDVERYDGGLDSVRAQVAARDVRWDVVDLSRPEAIRGCEEGLFEPIDSETLPPGTDGREAPRDFLAGTLTECAVGQSVFATVYAFDARAYPDAEPQTIADFFDLDGFPGKRAVRREPRVLMEWAAIAAGVPPDHVYEVLGRPEGVDLAFGELDRIRPALVWIDAAADPMRLLVRGEVAMAQTHHGRAQAAADGDRDLRIVWDGEVLEIEMWAIVRGTRHLTQALDFVAFASLPAQMAAQARHIAYGPARLTAMFMLDDEERGRLPNSAERLGPAVISDAGWWADNEARLEARFRAWLENGPDE